jgi:hypothetical protein
VSILAYWVKAVGEPDGRNAFEITASFVCRTVSGM